MANTFFVDPDSGNDSTGDGSGLNPWKTLDKAVNTGKAVGETLAVPTDLFIAGGATVREANIVDVVSSASAPLRIIGDIDGAAFGAAGVANPKTGPVTITATAADGSQIAGATLVLRHGYATLERLRIVNAGGGSPGAVHFSTNAGPRTLRDCEIICYNNGVALFCDPYRTNEPQDWLIDRCDITAGSNTIDISGSYAAGSHLLARSSRLATTGFSNGIRFRVDGLEVTVQNSLLTGNSTLVNVSASGASAGIARVYGSIISAVNNALNAATAGQIIENGNLIAASTPRVNVAAGADSKVVFDLELSLGLSGKYQAPLAGSRAVGWGSYGTTPALDLFGRPFASPPACGPIEFVAPTPPEPGGNTYIFQTEG